MSTPPPPNEEPLSQPRVAEGLDASFFEEDTTVPVPVAWRCTRKSHVANTTLVVEGDWLSDKDIAAWLTHKSYHNEVGALWAWAMAVTCVVSHLQTMKKYEST